MELKATRSINDGKITTKLTIEAFGNGSMSAEEEKELLNDYRIELDYGKMIFAGYVRLDNHKNPIIVKPVAPTEPDVIPSAPANTDEIVLQMPFETYKITDDMELTYAVDITKLESLVSNFEYIDDAICLGKAMIMVYENTVINYIKEMLEISRKHKDEFESEQYYTV